MAANSDTRNKCTEIINKYEEIIRSAERVNAERERFEALLRQKDAHIGDLLNSLSWRITAPLRAIYSLFRRG